MVVVGVQETSLLNATNCQGSGGTQNDAFTAGGSPSYLVVVLKNIMVSLVSRW
jgi:hypothetical protein